jgi:hypothetical protein
MARRRASDASDDATSTQRTRWQRDADLTRERLRRAMGEAPRMSDDELARLQAEQAAAEEGKAPDAA